LNVAHLRDHPRLELMRHDVTFPLYVEVDEIYNLAGPASPIHYQHDPVQTTKTSVHGAINMLGLAKRVKAKILQASTSEVYGDPELHPQTEAYWAGFRTPAGQSIRSACGRAMMKASVARKRCFSTIGASINCASKLCATYGPRMHPDDVGRWVGVDGGAAAGWTPART
jgi:UDP-glucuronate decarboxylase